MLCCRISSVNNATEGHNQKSIAGGSKVSFQNMRLPVATIIVAVLSTTVAEAQTARNLICNGCVGTKDLSRNAVTKKKIAKRAVAPSKLKAPTGAAGTTPVNRTNIVADQVIQTISVDIPKRGIVVVNASAYARFDTNDSQINCTITDGSTVESPFLRAAGSTAAADRRSIVAGTRAFEETLSGTKTYNLVCEPNSGDNIDVYDAVMTAIYAPTNILAD